MAPLRVFELHANGELVHLFGPEQAAEVIAVLARAVADSYELDKRPVPHSWAEHFGTGPAKGIVCRSKLCSASDLKRLKAGATL